ncbi:YoaK family protein [Aquihabitans sp. McL0605]|uniref:YoaK family protein n=1 Tax=Aquihabitans sp. McL0605 TaxID=3415671 RepID=UPI003CF45556
MTTETRHHPSGPLKLAITLAACAGFVDAHVYLNVTPVFVANMSGNLIHLGMFTGLGDWREAVASIVAFAGVAASIVHHDHQIQRGLPIGPSRLLAVEATLVVALSLLVARLHVGFTAQPSPRDLPILLIGGVAMGLQAGSLRRVGEISVATTYGTGAIVRIGEKVASGLGRRSSRRAPAPSDHRRARHRLVQLRRRRDRRRDRRTSTSAAHHPGDGPRRIVRREPPVAQRQGRRPRRSIERSRISTLRTLPVTVIGNSSVRWRYRGTL